MSDVNDQDVDKPGGEIGIADANASSSGIDTNNKKGKQTRESTDEEPKPKVPESWTENEHHPKDVKSSGDNPEHREKSMQNSKFSSKTVRQRDNVHQPEVTSTTSNNQQSTDNAGERDDKKEYREIEPRIKQEDTEKKSPYTIKRFTYCLKITYLFLLFILILGTGCFSRVLMHIMIWKLSPPHTMDRNLQLVSIFGYLQPDDDLVIRNSSCVDSSCSNGLPLSWTCTSIDNQTCTLAEEVPSTNVTWFWAVMLSISAPYFYTFLTNLSRYCTKFTHKINWKIMVVGFIRDLIHSAALCLLVFFVLPTMAPDMAALTSFIVICVPVFLNMNLKRLLPLNKVEPLQPDTEKNKFRSIFFYPILPVCSVILFVLSIAFFVVVVAITSNPYLVLETIFACVFISLEWFESFVVFKSKRVVSEEDEFGIFEAKIDEESKSDQNCKGCPKFLNWIFLYVACQKEREIYVLALIKFMTLNLIFFPLIIGFMTHWKVEWWRLLFVPNVNSSVHYNIHSKMNLVSSTEVAYGCSSTTPFIVMIICVCSTFVFFKLAQHACRIKFQKSEFIVPILLNLFITPLVIANAQWNNLAFIVDGCSVLQPLWKTKSDGKSLNPWLLRSSGITGFVSILLLTLHVWRNTSISLHKATKLFSKTTYCGLFPDVSLLLSRKADEKLSKVKSKPFEEKEELQEQSTSSPEGKPKEQSTSSPEGKPKEQSTSSPEGKPKEQSTSSPEGKPEEQSTSSPEGKSKEQSTSTPEGKSKEQSTSPPKEKLYIPIIIACATMWHEEYKEMCKLLTSVLRLGISSLTNKKKYGFEAHILFDDAFMDNEKGERCYNTFAKDLQDAVECSMRLCYRTNSGIELDYKKEKTLETEYGMRVEWDIIGKSADEAFKKTEEEFSAVNKMSKLFVHFKDKAKIRVKKRWSQVMYMHYLLAKKFVLESGSDLEDFKRLQQTFILALDGDVDFQPEAVDYLFEGMKRNKKVGACCGRIHPIGSGPMIWYQKFEYAASHWLQKATEHVCGCVLCSPGCFTLFRGSAIVDVNVLAIYSTEPKTPWQVVQYDQGEDRWLCTLLLKQGHRIEYCAASDAKTFAPEGFTEFFKQRRRWSPSTIANIIDILASSRYCADKNDSISMLYLIYQAFLLCTAIITPASILLLMIGAIVIAFDLTPWAAMILVLLPTIVFTMSIFAFTEDTQLFLASIISGVYAVVMLIVIIGILKAGIEAGFCSETTILICFVGGIFVVAAILHPQEWTCILPGLLYFFAVPAVSVILMIYSIGNINITSWGTREEIVDKKQKGKEVDCSFGTICRCILFPDHASSSNSGDAPKFTKEFKDKDIRLKVGETLDLQANITGYPKPKITWYLENRRIHRSSAVKIIFNISKVQLKKKNMQLLDSGTYCCVAKNEAGKCKLEAQVSVEGGTMVSIKPNFRKKKLKIAHKDNSILLEADVTGIPRPTITWKTEGTEIEPCSGLEPRQCGSHVSLKIEGSANFGRTYTCIASNNVGTAELQTDLNDASVDEKSKTSAPTDILFWESDYWKKRIVEDKQILHPNKNMLRVKDQNALSAKLRDLRNKVFFGFILINVLYFTFVFTLTQADSTLNEISFEIPCPDTADVLRLNPILIAFIVTFGIVLSIQFWGMIYHRMSTFIQIILSIEKGDTKKVKTRKYQKHQKTVNKQSSHQVNTPKGPAVKNWNRFKLATSFMSLKKSVKLEGIIEEIDTQKENDDQSVSKSPQ